MTGEHSGRFAMIGIDVVKDARIGDAAFRVYAALALHADRDGTCYPAIGVLAEMTGREKSAVRKQIRILEQVGAIKTIHQKGKTGVDKVSRYRLKKVGAPEVPLGERGVTLGAPEVPLVGAPEVPQTYIPLEQTNNVAAFPAKPTADYFESFWRIFPKRNPHSNGDKKATEKKFWLAVEKKGATVELLHQRARGYAEYVRRENVDPKYVVQAATWFNQDRWRNDDYDQPARAASEGAIAG